MMSLKILQTVQVFFFFFWGVVVQMGMYGAFVAVPRLFLVGCKSFSLQWLLLLQSMGCRAWWLQEFLQVGSAVSIHGLQSLGSVVLTQMFLGTWVLPKLGTEPVCTARWILNHWTTREALKIFLLLRLRLQEMVQPGESLGVQWSPPLLLAFGKDVEPNDCPHDPHGVAGKTVENQLKSPSEQWGGTSQMSGLMQSQRKDNTEVELRVELNMLGKVQVTYVHVQS